MTTQWPQGVSVGHEVRSDVVTLQTTAQRRLTPSEARMVAAQLILRADLQERNDKAWIVDGIPRAKEAS